VVRQNNTLLPLRWDDKLTDLILGAHDRIAAATGSSRRHESCAGARSAEI
jgi:hypothetical protein